LGHADVVAPPPPPHPRLLRQCEYVLKGHTGTVVCLRFDDMVLATAGGYARGPRCIFHDMNRSSD
jgi:hypothetical protein